jgi:SEC-C motif domain protein
MPDCCDCGKPQDYEHCCALLHQGRAPAESAEQLMRSRYSAFARGDVAYIVKTQTPFPAKASHDELAKDLTAVHWLKLEVLSHTVVSQTKAFVEFCAYALNFNGNQKQLIKHHEHSEFYRQDQQWLYKQGEIMPDSGQIKWPRNSSCICGSGRKYKQCCGS